MTDKAKAIIGLVIMLATLIGYIVKLEHRLTVIEQQNIRMEQIADRRDADLQKMLIQLDDGQREIMRYLFFD